MSNTFSSRRSANRRRRNEAREQILDVARRELKVKAFREISVDELMQETGLSRTAFYRFFPDREAVLIDLLEEVWTDLAEARDLDGPAEGEVGPASMARLRQLLADNRGVLKAVADAAASDEEVERTYHEFMYSYWIDDLTARIKKAQESGLAKGLDPEVAGEALGWMAERMGTHPSIEIRTRFSTRSLASLRNASTADEAGGERGARERTSKPPDPGEGTCPRGRAVTTSIRLVTLNSSQWPPGAESSRPLLRG